MAGITLLLLIVALAAETPAASFIASYSGGFRKPSMCVDETGSHPAGSTWYLEGCQMGECRSDGMDIFTIHSSCGLDSIPDGCEVVQDNTLNFPECCPTVVCSSERL
ncbi:U-scoloptoxin(16)-Er12a-like [Penaeus indicus]|uniref:U-scoloptoxin(16)-Er12a-like n=1 Tax=Penaeus indicus TaxID=29960 RepID=UPI00300C5702